MMPAQLNTSLQFLERPNKTCLVSKALSLMIPRVESPLCRLDARTISIRSTEAMIGLESISSFALGKERSAGKPDNIMTTGRQTPVDDDQSSARQTQFLITAFLCLTENANVI